MPLAVVGDHCYQGVADNTRYLVVANDQGSKVTSYELSFTLRYFLYDSEVRVVEPMDAQTLKTMLFDYDQIILFDNNGLLRRYVPKGVSIENFSEEDILWAADALNSLPRKNLGYCTPEELFEAFLDIVCAA